MNRRWTKEQREDAVKAFRNGMSYAEIREITSIPTGTISHWIWLDVHNKQYASKPAEPKDTALGKEQAVKVELNPAMFKMDVDEFAGLMARWAEAYFQEKRTRIKLEASLKQERDHWAKIAGQINAISKMGE